MMKQNGDEEQREREGGREGGREREGEGDGGGRTARSMLKRLGCLDRILCSAGCIPKFSHVSSYMVVCSTGIHSNRGSRDGSSLWSGSPC